METDTADGKEIPLSTHAEEGDAEEERELLRAFISDEEMSEGHISGQESVEELHCEKEHLSPIQE
jgi:hypothetical protein